MKNLLVIIICSFCMNFGFSQVVNPNETDTNTYVITKNDGTEYIGKIISDDGREVLIMTENLGKIFIPKADVKNIIKVLDKKSIVNGEFHSEGPFTTRHAFTTNALPIKKGENYALINLFGPEVHFAVTDHLNLGIMSTWGAIPIVFAAKYTIPTNDEKLNFSVGTLLGTSSYFNNFNGYGGLHFANVTYGDRKNNVTFSAGYGYISTFRISQFTDSQDSFFGPIFSVAGILKVGAKTSFIFDSMLGSIGTKSKYSYSYSTSSSGTVALFLMPGMRFQTKEKSAFQVSLAGVAVFDSGDAYSFPIPMCSWFYKF